MAENKKKNPIVAAIVALLMSLWFIYDGIKYLKIGYELKPIGIALLVCGVGLIVTFIIMMCKKPKGQDTKNTEL